MLCNNTHTLEKLTSDILRWWYLLQWPLTEQRFILQFVSTCFTCLRAKLATFLGCLWQAYVVTLKKSSNLALDFTTKPLQQEHVRDRTVKCTPAVHKQLHSTTPPQNLPVLWHLIREPWINVPACMKDLRGKSVCRVNITVGLRACVAYRTITCFIVVTKTGRDSSYLLLI